MNLDDILNNSKHKKEMLNLIKISNLAYRNWKLYWSDFYPEYICIDLLEELNKLSDLRYFAYGGFKNSERVKIACYRSNLYSDTEIIKLDFPGIGFNLKGNFLFDNATQNDFRNFFINLGIENHNIGDIWTLGERGAQGILTNSKNFSNKENKYFLRDVEVQIEIIELKELKTPIQRIEKYINTVEASKRLDAIASAGFRISRNKIVDRIKNGFLTLNGVVTRKPTISLKNGDKLKLENKGILEILEILETKRERWKIKLLKK